MKTFYEFFKDETGKDYPTPDDDDWKGLLVAEVFDEVLQTIPKYLDYVVEDFFTAEDVPFSGVKGIKFK